GGASQVVEGDGVSFSTGDSTEDSFSVVLTRPPDPNVTVSIKVTPPEGLVLLAGGVPQRLTSSETQVVALHNVVGQHFFLTLDGHNSAPLLWSASASDFAAAVLALVQSVPTLNGCACVVASDISVEQDGTQFTINFADPGHLAGKNIDPISAQLDVEGGDTPAPGGSVSFSTSQDGGFSLAQGLTLNYTASNWWIP